MAVAAALTGFSALARRLWSHGGGVRHCGDSFCSTSSSAGYAPSSMTGRKCGRISTPRSGARSSPAFSRRSSVRASQEGATSTRAPSEYDLTDPQSAQSSQPANEAESSSTERNSPEKSSKGIDGVENSAKDNDGAEKPEAATKLLGETDRLEDVNAATISSQDTADVEKSSDATISVDESDQQEKPSTKSVTSENPAERGDNPKQPESTSNPEKQATTPKPAKDSQESVAAKESSEENDSLGTTATKSDPSDNGDGAKKPTAKSSSKQTDTAASDGGAQRAPKPAAKKKPVAKPLEATMLEDVIPLLIQNLSNEDGLTDIDITFEENQLKASFAKGGIPYCFWAFFPDGKLEGTRGSSLTSHGSPPSTIEPFLIDEKKLTPELIVFWIKKRLFVQKLLSIN